MINISNRWLKDEIDRMKYYHNKGITDKEIAKRLNEEFGNNRTEKSVAVKRFRLKGKNDVYIRWQEDEIKKMIEYNNMALGDKIIAKKINEEFGNNRSAKSVSSKRFNMGIKKKTYSDKEIKRLKELYNKGIKIKNIVKRLNNEFDQGRTYKAIALKLHKLGISRKTDNYSDKEEKRLKELFNQNLTDKEITDIINKEFETNRTVKAIGVKRFRMGLVRYDYNKQEMIFNFKKLIYKIEGKPSIADINNFNELPRYETLRRHFGGVDDIISKHNLEQDLRNVYIYRLSQLAQSMDRTPKLSEVSKAGISKRMINLYFDNYAEVCKAINKQPYISYMTEQEIVERVAKMWFYTCQKPKDKDFHRGNGLPSINYVCRKCGGLTNIYNQAKEIISSQY